jgi:hypothetical protein
VAPPKKKKRRNASIAGGQLGANLMGVAVPAIGIGAGAGFGLLKLAESTKMSPMALAAAGAAVGTIGVAVTKKGPIQQAFAGLAALSSGLTLIDALQRKPAAPAQQQPQQPQQQHPQQVAQQQHRQAQARYVTPEEMNDALKRAMMESHEATVGQLKEELRNAFAMYQRPESDEERRDAEAVHEEFVHEEHRNAEVYPESWHAVHRDADPIEAEHVHPHPDGVHRDAGEGGVIVEDWHHHAAA